MHIVHCMDQNKNRKRKKQDNKIVRNQMLIFGLYKNIKLRNSIIIIDIVACHMFGLNVGFFSSTIVRVG